MRSKPAPCSFVALSLRGSSVDCVVDRVGDRVPDRIDDRVVDVVLNPFRRCVDGEVFSNGDLACFLKFLQALNPALLGLNHWILVDAFVDKTIKD